MKLARLRPPAPDTWSRGFPLALLVHALLLVALAFGVHWRSREPIGIEAELWAALPQQAAPKVEAPPKVEPPKPAPPPQPPKAVEPPQPNEAEIALEKARQERLKREQAEQDERKRRQAEDLRKQEEQRRRDEERAEKQREQEQERKLARLREENLERLRAQAGGATDSTGSAAKSAGPSAGYAGRIVARVKPNIVFGDDLPGNPSAVVEVRAAPDGTIIGRRLVKSSGSKAWDEAVLRAIDRTETLPRDIDGSVPSPIEIKFTPG